MMNWVHKNTYYPIKTLTGGYIIQKRVGENVPYRNPKLDDNLLQGVNKRISLINQMFSRAFRRSRYFALQYREAKDALYRANRQAMLKEQDKAARKLARRKKVVA